MLESYSYFEIDLFAIPIYTNVELQILCFFFYLIQGAVTGVVVGTVVIFWIVIGAFVYKAPLPELPFRTDGCSVAHEVHDLFNQFSNRQPDFSATAHPDIITQLVTAEPMDWSVY